ncbi:MAG: iron-sulfur cluster assembly scaffold protein [Pseudomonadota bacterium]
MWLNIIMGCGVLIVILTIWSLVHYFANPQLVSANGIGRATGKCGDTMEIRLAINAGKVIDVSHWTNGCAYSLTCVEAAASLAKGKDVVKIQDINADSIRERVGMPQNESADCAMLAVSTLHAAVKDYLTTHADKA